MRKYKPVRGEEHTTWWTIVLRSTMFVVGLFASRWKRGTRDNHSTSVATFKSFTSDSISLQLRSRHTTGRSWWDPAGGDHRNVILSNILVLRMLYLPLVFDFFWLMCFQDTISWHGIVRWDDSIMVNILNLSDCRLFYAHQRGIHFIVEQPIFCQWLGCADLHSESIL